MAAETTASTIPTAPRRRRCSRADGRRDHATRFELGDTRRLAASTSTAPQKRSASCVKTPSPVQ